jgi:carbonic anhydrase
MMVSLARFTLKYSPASQNLIFVLSFFKDPNKWKEHNSLCAGEHQSPINIDTRKSKTEKFPPFRFHNYAKGLPENLENNGHTGMFTCALILLKI